MNITNDTMISTPSGLRSFAALKYLSSGKDKVIGFETVDQFPMYVIGSHQVIVKPRGSTGSDNMLMMKAENVDISEYVICIPIEKIQRPCNISVSIDNQVQHLETMDWFIIGSYVGTSKHFLDAKTLTPSWNILYEFDNVIPEWVQRLPNSDVRLFLDGFETNATKPSWIPVKSKCIGIAIQRLYAKVGCRTHAYYNDPALFVIIDTNELEDPSYIYMDPTNMQAFDLS